MSENKKKSISKNAVFNVAYKLLNILFPMLTIPYLSRVLGPYYIGKVNFAQSIISYFLIFASLGIPTYGIREIAKVSSNDYRKNRVFSELFFINLTSTVLISILYTVLILRFNIFREDFLLYLCVGLTLYLNVFNVDWLYSGLEEYVYITIRSAIVKIFSIIAIFYFINDQQDYVFYSFLLSLATVGNYFFNIYNLRKRVSLSLKRLNFIIHLKPVIILLVTILVSDIYLQMDITMLGFFCGHEEVGYYSSGIRLIRVILSITMAVSATIIPRLSQYFNEGNCSDFKKLFWKTCNCVWIIVLPAFVGVLLLDKEIVISFFGYQFLSTIDVVRMLSVMIIIVSFSYLIGSVVLTSTNNEKYLLKATLLGCITNLMLNFILIPTYGMYGAAFASLMAECIVFFVHFYYGFPYIKGKINAHHYSTVFLSVLVMSMVVFVIKTFVESYLLRIIASFIFGSISFLIVLVFLRNTFVIDTVSIIFSKVLNIRNLL